MKPNPVYDALQPIRELLESLGPKILFRKLHGIANALAMQIEDRDFHKHAVSRLCEAMLATAELYRIDEQVFARLEVLTCKLIELAQDPANRS